MPVSIQNHGDIAVITVDNPPVNALSQAVRAGLAECTRTALADAAVTAIVIIGAGRTFIAGADIREFNMPATTPGLNDVIAGFEAAGKPVVAAIHGTALGGGLETALGCHYRVALSSAMVGLPEVKLGLLPGAGGTQRLPRLTGVKAAMALISTGDFVPAAKALDMGIIDQVVDGDLLAGALAYARQLVADGAALKRVRDLTAELAEGETVDALKAAQLKAVARRTRGQPAPEKCLESVANAVTMPFDAALAREREIFEELKTGPESQGLRHAFFAERAAGKVPGVTKETATRPIEKVAVIGAGTMGGGISMNFANVGIPVTIIETEQAALDRGLGIVEKNYAATVSKGRLSQEKMDQRMALLSGALDLTAAADADIVIEAVFENMALKKEIFAKLDEICKPGAILASNTSTLDVDEIASVTKRPQDVIGTHFFSPANVMKLLEIVRGEKTAPDVLNTTMKLGKKIQKVPVVVGVCDGFVGNRMLHAYTRQAGFLIEDGALPQDVDRVIFDFGLPMGPFTMGDMAGLDVGYRVRQERGRPPANYRYSEIADKVVEMGRHGQKTNAGWYRYVEGNRTPQPDPEIERLILDSAAAAGIARKDFDDTEILHRCMFALINEGAKILEEGMAYRASDIDVIYVNGYGFPSFRGGPMNFADQVGVEQVYATVKAMYEAGDEWMAPAPLLAKLAAEGKSFADYDAETAA